MKISACVITKNEEENLPVCLNSVKSIASEIIVVDTGSTDRTVDIAKSHGAKVFSFSWINDFAAARNFAIEQATSEWIVFLDADEYFAPESVKNVPGAIKEANQKNLDMVICMMTSVEKKTGKMISSNLHIRIFKNHPQIRYVGAVHERIVRLDKPANALDMQKEITIIHTGYSEENIHGKEKSKRNLTLLFQELQKQPDSFDLLFYISESYLLDRQFEKALEFAMRAKQYQNSRLKGIYEKNYINIFQCLIHLEKPKEEIARTVREAIELYPNYPDFYIYLGDIYKNENRYRDAIFSYQTGLKLLDQSLIAQTNTMAASAKVLDTVGNLFGKLKEWNQCVQYYVQALQVDRYLYSSLQNLMNVLGRFEAPEKVFSFFVKLYDLNSTKDRLYLLRAALDTNLTVIAKVLLESLPASHDALHEYNALYQYLIGRYDVAYESFLSLYQHVGKEEYAYGAIASAWKGKLETGIAGLENTFSNQPAMSLLSKHIFGGTSPVSIDKTNVYSFLIYACGTLHITDHHLLADLAKRSDLSLEMANYLYYREEYISAYQFFNQYLEQGETVPDDILADVTLKVGDCLLQNGFDDHAWAFLQKAHTLSPENYLVYELLIGLAIRKNRLNEVIEILDTGLRYYPDSYHLNQTLKETKGLV